MIHNEVSQIGQTLNQMYQMAEQMRQMEESNRQLLNQLAQREANAVQQIQTFQQMLQQSNRAVQSLQNQIQGTFSQNLLSQNSLRGTGTYSNADISVGPTQNFAQGIMRTSSPMVDPRTMNPSSYTSSLQRFNI